jgi:hypothetical protein
MNTFGIKKKKDLLDGTASLGNSLAVLKKLNAHGCTPGCLFPRKENLNVSHKNLSSSQQLFA